MKTRKNVPSLFVDMDGTLVEWRVAADSSELFREGFFLEGAPYQNVVAGLRIISDDGNAPISSLSAYLTNSAYALSEKGKWLDSHTPYIERRYFVPCGEAKASFIERTLGRPLTKQDILLDDYSMNLHAWQEAGGTGVKLMNGINGTNGTWHGPAVNSSSTPENIADYLRRVFQMVAEFA